MSRRLLFILMFLLSLLMFGCTNKEKEEVWEDPYCFESSFGSDFCTETEEIFNDIFIVVENYMRDNTILLEPEREYLSLSEYIETKSYNQFLIIDEIRAIERNYEVLYTGMDDIEFNVFDVLTNDITTEVRNVEYEVRKFEPSTVQMNSTMASILIGEDVCMLSKTSLYNYIIYIDEQGYPLFKLSTFIDNVDNLPFEIEGLTCQNQINSEYENYIFTYITEDVSFMYEDEFVIFEDLSSWEPSKYRQDDNDMCHVLYGDIYKEYALINGIVYTIQEALDNDLFDIDILEDSNLPNCVSMYYSSPELVNYEYKKEPVNNASGDFAGYEVFVTNYKFNYEDYDYKTFISGTTYNMISSMDLNYRFLIEVNDDYYTLQEALDEGFITQEDLLECQFIYSFEYGFYSEQE